MSNTELTSNPNTIALAKPVSDIPSGNKLKHWTQAIRDLYDEFLQLKGNVVPKYHASISSEFGVGDEIKYGHLKLLDSMSYNFTPYGVVGGIQRYWKRSNLEIDSRYKWNAVTFHDGMFVAVGSGGRIATSTNGKDWSEVKWFKPPTSYAGNLIHSSTPVNPDSEAAGMNNDSTTQQNQPTQIEFFDVAWCGNMFAAVGSYSSFVYSYDGVYWYMPMYVGKSYNSSNVCVPETYNDDLTVCTPGITEADAWKGIAYDSRTGIIMLCGTQCRTMALRYTTTSTISSVVFEPAVFHTIPTSNLSWQTHELNSIASVSMKDKSGQDVTYFVACGNFNETVQILVESADSVPHGPMYRNGNNSGQISYLERTEPVQIEWRNRNSNGTSESLVPGVDNRWNSIMLTEDHSGAKTFVMVGTDGMAMLGMFGDSQETQNGIDISWLLSPYDFSSKVKSDFTCQASGENLTVIAGEWPSDPQAESSPENYANIVMYNDFLYREEQSGSSSSQSSISHVKHFTCYVDDFLDEDNARTHSYGSWNGAAYGNGVFVLAGDSNRLYYQEIYEMDYYGAALSVKFYKRYLAEMAERLSRIERYVISYDMSPVELNNGESATINWNDDRNAYMFQTSGNVKLYFNSAPSSVYKEAMVYLEAIDATNLDIVGATWENDSIAPIWGKKNCHLMLRAIFLAQKVTLQVIDNDQLADNLLDSDAIGG